MLLNHLSSALSTVLNSVPLSGLLVLTTVAPGLANLQLEATDSPTASDLGNTLEINCEQATAMGITLFYVEVDGQQVPVDCLSLLRLPGESRSVGTGEPPNFDAAVDTINRRLETHSDRSRFELLRLEF